MKSTFSPQQVSQLERMPVEYELCMSLSWLSNLRWIASAGVIVATLFTRSVLGLGLDVVPLTITAGIIALYNLAFRAWLNRIQCDLSGSSTQAHTLARLQIAADWIAMTALIHFSGGVESPMILYFFFHIILAAILLPEPDTYLFAGLATLLLAGTYILEYLGWLPHHHIEGLLPVELHQNPMYVFAVLFFFTSTVGVSALLATRTTRRLRTRQKEMAVLGRDLHRAYNRLESLYESAQVVGSTLELQEVLDRLTRSTTEVMGVRGCTIRLMHETGTQLCLESWYGLSEEYLRKGCLLIEQNELVRDALAGEVVCVPDIRQDGRLQYPAEAVAEGIRSTLTAPLPGRSRPLGVIRVYSDEVDCFDEEDAHFLATVARYGSIAIENAMAYETVQNLEEAKRKFVLLVTHELRAPVGVIRSLLKTLSGGYAGELPDVQSDIVGRALRRAEFLQTLIDDLLDLAGSKSGLRVTTAVEQVNLQDILQMIVERYEIPAAEKGLDLQCDIESEGPLEISANAEEIDRAITNLVSNAVKYTPAGGKVHIKLRPQRGVARLEVSDTGIGIPAEAQAHLFEEFYRAPNAKAQVKQGTGLGLVITKDIVTRYGGTIRVDSAAGQGTTFTVMLPLSDEEPDRRGERVEASA